MLVQGTNSVNRLLQWLRLAGYAPNGWPTPGPSKLRPVAQMALDGVVRLQPARVLRAALAVSAAYRTHSLSDANSTGNAAVHETRPKEPAASRDGVCYHCNGTLLRRVLRLVGSVVAGAVET
ncbi:hypothetical protein MTO96_008625 [Rhipicephalus appendiculatus]